MKYIGMPMGMWALFSGSFQKQLTVIFGYEIHTAKNDHEKSKAEIQRDYSGPTGV